MKSYQELLSEMRNLEKKLATAKKNEREQEAKKLLKIGKVKGYEFIKNNYEDTQSFNFLTSFFHSTRYKNLIKLVKKISRHYDNLRVIDIGCGTAKAYSVLSSTGIKFEYLGIELRDDYVNLALSRYKSNKNFSIICESVENTFKYFNNSDVIIGLESLEHIPESVVVKTIEAIGKSNCKYMYFTAPNEIGPAILIKNIGSFLMGYPRYKEYLWKETFFASIFELEKVGRHGVGHKGFDWRWLAHTLRQHCKIISYTSNPYNFVPKLFSPSIGFICRNDKQDELT